MAGILQMRDGRTVTEIPGIRYYIRCIGNGNIRKLRGIIKTSGVCPEVCNRQDIDIN